MTRPTAPSAALHCLVCGDGELLPVQGFGELPRITSDCRPFRLGGELAVCRDCGAVQKLPTASWLAEIREIYAVYESYYQSGGDEQIVFDRASGKPRRRSDVLMERIAATNALPERGVALDVGCGNGVTLSSMCAALPAWSLNGFELGEGALARLQRIPRFDRLHTRSLAAIGRRFDLVTMVHSLEHFPDPHGALLEIRPLAGDGHLFVEVCNVEQNPFDVLVADHLMHFSPATLARLLAHAGFAVSMSAADWVPKEISVLARPVSGEVVLPGPERTGDVHRRISEYVQWLRDVAALGRRLADDARLLGIFGTSIAATWLAAQLQDRVAFFVDEDESRVGRQHLGKPIHRPADVPRGAVVYLALAPAIASLIAGRLGTSGLDLVLPPALSARAGQ
ncbi:MAG: class I SAM-dependent methyltransferase [Burkholderiales bacterium]